MNLLEFCQSITLSDLENCKKVPVTETNYLSSGFIDSDSKNISYLFPFEDRKSCAYIWNFYAPSKLATAICPCRNKHNYLYSFEDGQKTPAHVQNYVEFAYVVKGKLHLHILEKDLVLQEGELCLIDTNCVHQEFLHNDSSVILFLSLRDSVLAEIMGANVTAQKIVSFLQQAIIIQKDQQQYLTFRPVGNVRDEFEFCLSMLTRELYEDKLGANFIIKGLLMRIFRLLSTEYEFHLTKNQKKELNAAVFIDVCHYIENNYKTVTIRELSEVFHFQEDYFNRLIKKNTGQTYCDLLQNIRIFKAQELLASTQMSIAEISREVGYCNKGYFYKLFSLKYGMTPAEYREQL